MSPPEKVEPLAVALAVALVLVAALAVGAVFQVCWNHGLADLVGGTQIGYWPAFWSILGIGLVGWVFGSSPRKP